MKLKLGHEFGQKEREKPQELVNLILYKQTTYLEVSHEQVYQDSAIYAAII